MDVQIPLGFPRGGNSELAFENTEGRRASQLSVALKLRTPDPGSSRVKDRRLCGLRTNCHRRSATNCGLRRSRTEDWRRDGSAIVECRPVGGRSLRATQLPASTLVPRSPQSAISRRSPMAVGPETAKSAILLSSYGSVLSPRSSRRRSAKCQSNCPRTQPGIDGAHCLPWILRRRD